jgi:hypothetical protein
VSSAANTLPPLSSSDTQERAGQPRPNPVPLEVAVAVSGAKPASDNGSRDLFSEDTTTVLVFKDGAVIRLVAPVSPGQLLFLTNKKTNQEVVCQVLSRRDLQQQSCYVELQFTEDRPNFWEVDFPANPNGAPELKLPGQLHAQQIATRESNSPVATRAAEDVDQLKKEVEALRTQLLATQKKDAVQPAPKPTADAPPTPPIPESPNPAPPKPVPVVAEQHSAPASQHLAPLNDPAPPLPAHQPEPAPTLLMPAAKDKAPVARPVVSMALPVRKPEPAPDKKSVPPPPANDGSNDDLLPKPELDFSKVPDQAAHGQPASAVPASASKVRVIVLSAVLLAALAGATWYGKTLRLRPLCPKLCPSPRRQKRRRRRPLQTSPRPRMPRQRQQSATPPRIRNPRKQNSNLLSPPTPQRQPPSSSPPIPPGHSRKTDLRPVTNPHSITLLRPLPNRRVRPTLSPATRLFFLLSC